MGRLLITVVYLVAIGCLYRLWHSPRTALWWTVLGLLVLMFWTAQTIKTAVTQAAREYSALTGLPLEHALAHPMTDVERFWVKVNLAVSLLTLVISVYGLLTG